MYKKKFVCIMLAVVMLFSSLFSSLFSIPIACAETGTWTDATSEPLAVRYEAENANYGSCGVFNSDSGFSGTGYVGLFDGPGKKVIFTVDVTTGGAFDIDFSYATIRVPCTKTLYVNDVKISQLNLEATADWSTWGTVTETVTLNPGSNTIKLFYDEGDSEYLNLDYIDVTPAGAEPEPDNVFEAPKVGDIITNDGIDWTAQIVKSFDFSTTGAPFVGEKNTWDGCNGVWAENPYNNNDKALLLNLFDNKGKIMQKSQIGSLGFTAEEISSFAQRSDYMVRVQFRRWQKAGGVSYMYWSAKDNAGKELWLAGNGYTKSTGAENGDIKTVDIPCTDKIFPTNAVMLRVGFEYYGNNVLETGEQVYFDDVYFTVYKKNIPAAPTYPIVDDGLNTFGWTEVEGYAGYQNYEYTTSGGITWEACSANPQPLENLFYSAGDIGVRVKAIDEVPTGAPLMSDKAYSYTPEMGEEYENITLWRLGLDNNSDSEFSDFSQNTTENIAVPVNWNTTNDWSFMSKGMKLTKNSIMNITYNLEAIPENGVEFSCRVLDAGKAIPQMAVFSNGVMAGLIQIAGINGSNAVDANGNQLKFKEMYKLYIPKEFLQVGENVLKLQVDRGLYADSTGDDFLWWNWDRLQLDALGGAAKEPIHGRYIHLGTTLANLFTYDDAVIRQYPQLTKWMGIAYSGNWIRTSLWTDGRDKNWTPYAKQLFTTLKDLNITPAVDILGGDVMKSADMAAGIVTDSTRTYVQNFMQEYGDLFQYVELDNEPGVFNHSLASNLAFAELLSDLRSIYMPHLKIVAPGWAYWPSNGTPDGWARNLDYRRQVEDYCDMTNGHSYATTNVTQARGATLVESLLTYPEYTGDGLAKELVMTETGANDNHTDSTAYGTFENRFSAVFDREIRGDIGFADHIMHHAAFFSEKNISFSLFDFEKNADGTQFSWKTHQAENTSAWHNKNDENSVRLDTFRRLALAYATHGSPLTYNYINRSELQGKKAYFRAVDTSGIGASGIGAASDKILLNFVNFETTDVSMNVKVKLLENAVYCGERFGAGDAYEAAHSIVELNAATDTQEVELTETLKPGESVQYILNVKETVKPTTPEQFLLQASDYYYVKLAWNASSDNKALAGYKVYRSDIADKPLAIIPETLTYYNDYAVAPNSSYAYTVRAFDESGNESDVSSSVSVTTNEEPVTPYTVIQDDEGNDMRKYEAEDCVINGGANKQRDADASGGQTVGNLHSGSMYIMNSPFTEEGKYTLDIRYANGAAASTTKQLYINGSKVTDLSFDVTGGWAGSSNYKDLKLTVNIAEEKNTIALSGGGGVNVDYIILKEGEYIPLTFWQTNIEHNDQSIYYSSASFAADGSDSYHNTNTAGDYAIFTFSGTGIRWYSKVESYMGEADIYIDGEFDSTVDLTNPPTGERQGDNKIVFEKIGLHDGIHNIKVVSKEDGNGVPVYGFQIYGVENKTILPGPDLIITDLSWEQVPSGSKRGMVFSITVKNIGILDTPEGVVTGVAYSVDGGTVSWSDSFNKVIKPGESVVLTANGSSDGTGIWTIPKDGTYTVSAMVDDINRYVRVGKPEMRRDNNSLSKELVYTEDYSAPIAPTGLMVTGKTETSVSLTWIAATDNVGVSGYDVYNGATKVNASQITVTKYTVNGLSQDTTYIFTVKAKDASGNISEASNSVTVKTNTPESGEPDPNPDTDVDQRDSGVSSKVAKSTVDLEALTKAFENSEVNQNGIKTIQINTEAVEGAQKYEIELPKEFFIPDKKNNEREIEIKTSLATVVIPENMLNANDLKKAESISVSVATVNETELKSNERKMIGDRPVIEINLIVEGMVTEWKNNGASVTVSLDYIPTSEELKHPESIVIWYLDGKGNITSVPNGRYNNETGEVTFTTNHFSKYAIAYNHKSFADCAKVSWAKNQIEVMVSKGILSGTSQSKFSPETSISRAEFMDALVKALNISADYDSNFIDIDKSSIYYESIAIAKELGITAGVGNNKFNPEADISRQDMSVLVLNALKILNKASATEDSSVLQRYSDASKISVYALEGMTELVDEGILIGNGKSIDPKGKVARAQAAVIVYKLYNK